MDNCGSSSECQSPAVVAMSRIDTPLTPRTTSILSRSALMACEEGDLTGDSHLSSSQLRPVLSFSVAAIMAKSDGSKPLRTNSSQSKSRDAKPEVVERLDDDDDDELELPAFDSGHMTKVSESTSILRSKRCSRTGPSSKSSFTVDGILSGKKPDVERQAGERIEEGPEIRRSAAVVSSVSSQELTQSTSFKDSPRLLQRRLRRSADLTDDDSSLSGNESFASSSPAFDPYSTTRSPPLLSPGTIHPHPSHAPIPHCLPSQSSPPYGLSVAAAAAVAKWSSCTGMGYPWMEAAQFPNVSRKYTLQLVHQRYNTFSLSQIHLHILTSEHAWGLYVHSFANMGDHVCKSACTLKVCGLSLPIEDPVHSLKFIRPPSPGEGIIFRVGQHLPLASISAARYTCLSLSVSYLVSYVYRPSHSSRSFPIH